VGADIGPSTEGQAQRTGVVPRSSTTTGEPGRERTTIIREALSWWRYVLLARLGFAEYCSRDGRIAVIVASHPRHYGSGIRWDVTRCASERDPLRAIGHVAGAGIARSRARPGRRRRRRDGSRPFGSARVENK